MKRLIYLIPLLICLPANGQSLWRNFFTTNRVPVVDVLAGSNAVVVPTLTGTDQRHFTVHSKTDTNVVNALIGSAGAGQTNNTIVIAGTNATVVTNASGGITTYTVSSTATGTGTAQTNISWTAVTNLQSAQVPYTVITNAPWQYGDSDLTNWATLNTNVLSTLGQTNISYTAVTNAPWQYGSANLTNWSQLPTNYVPPNAGTSIYAALLTSTAIGLADTNWVLNQIATLGSYVYFGGPTNTFAITNSGETVARTNVYTGSVSPFVNSSTSSISGLTLNAYARHVISTNTFANIEAGPVSIATYPFKTGALDPSGHYEFYVVDTVSNIMYELGATPTIPVSQTSPQLLTSTITLTNGFLATNRCYVALAFKIDNVGSPGATLSWAHGGSYDAHMTFVRPLSSATINASQITGVISPTNLATNTPAANQVLTATSATSAAWQTPGATSGSASSMVGQSATTALSSGTSPYWGIFGSATPSGTENLVSQVVPFSCYITNLYLKIAPGLGAQTNTVITVYTNGVASNLTASGVGNGAIQVISNITSSVSVSAGSFVSIYLLPNNASSSASQRISFTMQLVAQ